MNVELQNIIANVGFPIVVSIILLTRIEGKLAVLSDSINGLSKIIETIITKQQSL
ncbi:YvrJ family protein [Peptacetobacter sp.]|uniref:YvrJ family protein n=1 Tax=Peptacetobacter sp. TaxID=2991975 RepID=UPI00261F89C6|nr:YvrJ family protein [Peptacetobacter sp.]